MGKLSNLKRALDNYKTRIAHHGSPHEFDKFSMSKIGTGEGAQAYGHGLYFTSKEEIAKFYRDALTDPDSMPLTLNGKAADLVYTGDIHERFPEMYKGLSPGDVEEMDYVLGNLFQVSNIDDYERGIGPSMSRRARQLYDEKVKPNLKDPDPATGRLYTVEIPDESHMLDWDKPLSEQPEAVQRALRAPSDAEMTAAKSEIERLSGLHEASLVEYRETGGFASLLDDALGRSGVEPDPDIVARHEEIGRELQAAVENLRGLEGRQRFSRFKPETRGRDIYRQLVGDVDFGISRRGWEGDPDAANAFLMEHDIPGITYKGATSGERNFVVFDEDLIDIQQKGAVDPRLLAPIAGAAAFAQARQEKTPFWREAKGALEAAATVGTGMVGGLVGDLSRVGGYLNPLMPVEQTEAGANALANMLTYNPSQDANRALEAVGGVIEGGIRDVERGIDALNVRESIPYKAYEALPERAKGIVRTAADWAL